MTEKEIKNMELEVLADETVDPTFEANYLKDLLESFKTERDKILCNFRMWSYVRDDERLQSCKKEMKRVRDCIEAITKRLDELSA